MNEKNYENPGEKFKRLATVRTNAVLEKLRILGNCSNSSVYEYTEKDIEKIFSTIENQVKETRMRFVYNSKSREEFRL